MLLERIHGFDPTIDLAVIQVFGKDLVASSGLGSGKQQRVVELEPVLLSYLQRPYSPSVLLAYDADVLKRFDILSYLFLGHPKFFERHVCKLVQNLC